MRRERERENERERERERGKDFCDPAFGERNTTDLCCVRVRRGRLRVDAQTPEEDLIGPIDGGLWGHGDDVVPAAVGRGGALLVLVEPVSGHGELYEVCDDPAAGGEVFFPVATISHPLGSKSRRTLNVSGRCQTGYMLLGPRGSREEEERQLNTAQTHTRTCVFAAAADGD